MSACNPSPSHFPTSHSLIRSHSGVASVALRSLHHAAECLTVRREQEEALSIFIRIHKETGWRIGFIPKDLMEKWGWDPNEAISPNLPTQDDPSNHYLNKQFVNGLGGRSQYSAQMFDQYAENKRIQDEQRKQSIVQQPGQHATHTPPTGSGAQQQQGDTPTQPRKMPPPGIVNPMFGDADFSAPKHPYQDYYVAPNQHMQQQQHGQMGLTLMGIGANNYAPPPPPNTGYQY